MGLVTLVKVCIARNIDGGMVRSLDRKAYVDVFSNAIGHTSSNSYFEAIAKKGGNKHYNYGIAPAIFSEVEFYGHESRNNPELIRCLIYSLFSPCYGDAIEHAYHEVLEGDRLLHTNHMPFVLDGGSKAGYIAVQDVIKQITSKIGIKVPARWSTPILNGQGVDGMERKFGS